MNNKKLGIYFAISAALYFIFTAFITGHGIHFTNSAIAAVLSVIALYFFIKSKKDGDSKRNGKK